MSPRGKNKTDEFADIEPRLVEAEEEPVYTAIFNHSPFALSLTKMPGGRLVNVNNAFLKLFGFTREQVIGKTSSELAITDAESRAAIAAELQKSGAVYDFECTRHSNSGEVLFLAFSLDWVDLKGAKYILTTIRDITAQKQAEQALATLSVEAQTSRQRLQAVMESLPAGVCLLDEKGGNIQANRAFERVWGNPRPPVDGVNDYPAYKAWWADSGKPVQPEEWASARAVQQGETVTGQVMKIQRFDGSYAYVMNSAAPIIDQQGRVIGCAVAIQDISELKRHEDEVRQLNRTLKALSNTNQAMLHATRESDFLDEVCRIIVEDCGFAMVWIGFLQADEHQSVKPVASAGFEQGYVEALDISLSDPVRGIGPTGMAIRTGKAARCNNMLTDPKFAPWRQAALERGYASSIVLPLLVNEQAFGAINIYAREPEGFSDEEEKLLVELARDLAFGITHLRQIVAGTQATQALRLSEERYRSLFDNMTEGFALHEIVCDETGKPCDYRFLEVNPSFERLTGLKRETAVGRLASEVLPGLEPYWIQIYGQVALTGRPVQLENYTQTLGRYFQIYAYQPVPGQFAVIFVDVTERKRIEEDLRLSEHRFYEILQSISDGFWAVDNQWCFTYMNQRAAENFGYRPDDLLGKNIWEAFPNIHDTPHELYYRKVMAERIPCSFEIEGVLSEHAYSINVYPSGSGISVFWQDITLRKHAEKQLSLVAEKYTSLFDNTSDGIWIHNLDGVIQEANDAYCNMSGYTRSELIGMPISKLEANENPQEITDHIQKLIRQGGHDRFESRHRRKDGTFIDVDITALYMERDGGRVAIFVRDITARKQAEQRLAYLASFPELNPNPVVEVTLDGEVRYTNPVARQLFPDLKDLKALHPWLENWETITQPFRSGEATSFLRDVTYQEHCYQQSLAFLATEGLIRIYGIDISTRKSAEDAMRLSEERYRTIVETAAEGVILAQPDGKYIYVNQQMANMLGYEVDEMLGKNGQDFTYDDQPAAIIQLRDELHRGRILRGEFRFRRKDGSPLWSMYNVAPVFNEQGEHISNLAMHTDITERKQADEALNRAHDELEQHVRERTQELNIANDQLRSEVAEREKAQAELESSLLELQVIEEELRNNNEMLLDAQKILETERQRYQDLFEFAPDAYLVTDKNGMVLEANQFATTLFGIKHSTLINKPLIIFVAQADHLAFHHLLSAFTTQRAIQAIELKMTSRHGLDIFAAVKVARAEEQGGKYSLRWTIRDITQRKRAEEQIRLNSLRNSVLSEVSQSLAGASLDEKAILDIVTKTTASLVGDSCVITLVSGDGKWLQPAAWHHKKPEALALMSTLYGTAHNPSAEGPSGRVFQASQSLLIKEFPPEDSHQSIASTYQDYLDAIGISSLLIVPIQVSGTTIGTLGITRDKGGQPYTEDDQSMLEILASRTGQTIHNARLYQELQAALQKELEIHDQLVQSEKFAAVGRLLASITHEINNPLQTIKNCLYLSQMDAQPGTPLYDALAIATTETNRLSNLVAQLREIYRPPTQGLHKPVSLPTLVDEVQVLLVSYLQEKHVQWLVTPPEPDLFTSLVVEGVPDQLKQVFLNICLNAIDAMEPQGGSIHIDFIEKDDPCQVGVGIRDTGPGLPDEIKAKLFEPFSTTKEKGLGLGLAICYDIMQKHNGRIEVESEPGQGASFTIWLPATRN